MKAELADPKYAGVELAEIAYGADEPASFDTATGLMQRYPDLAGIIGTNSFALSATARAVQSAGQTGNVMVTGLGTPNDMRQYVKDGVVPKFILWSPKDLGYLGLLALKGLIDGSLTGAEERPSRPAGSASTPSARMAKWSSDRRRSSTPTTSTTSTSDTDFATPGGPLARSLRTAALPWEPVHAGWAPTLLNPSSGRTPCGNDHPRTSETHSRPCIDVEYGSPGNWAIQARAIVIAGYQSQCPCLSQAERSASRIQIR